jgi:hypothetical protein
MEVMGKEGRVEGLLEVERNWFHYPSDIVMTCRNGLGATRPSLVEHSHW